MKLSKGIGFLALFFMVGLGFAAEEESVFIYDAKGARDPFVMYQQARSEEEIDYSGKLLELSQLEVKGILWDEKRPLAMIRDEIIAMGQELLGAKVLKITKDEVTLEYKGEKVTLKVPVDEDPLGLP